jgi:hypothetical protein
LRSFFSFVLEKYQKKIFLKGFFVFDLRKKTKKNDNIKCRAHVFNLMKNISIRPINKIKFFSAKKGAVKGLEEDRIWDKKSHDFSVHHKWNLAITVNSH